jgi:hypothetical protein
MMKTTSSLNDARNDTGRVAYCGPFVISAVTGHPISRVEEEIRTVRGQDGQVVGTTAEDVRAALWRYGYQMVQTQTFMHVERKARPTVWTWMQRPRNAWVHYLIAIHKGKVGHWILIKGVKCCDTYSLGKWQFVCDGPHRGARIMEIFEVRRAEAGH